MFFRFMALMVMLGSSPAAAQDDSDLDKFFGAYSPILVKIQTDGIPEKDCRSEGTGFVVGSKNGRSFVLTAAHVLASQKPNCTNREIIGRPFWEPDAEVPLKIEFSNATDVALLSTDWTGAHNSMGQLQLCSAPFGPLGTPIARLIFLGYFADDATPLPGWGRIETPFDPAEFRQRIGGSINHGMSGGPVLNTQGQIIGIMRERVEKDNYNNEVVGKAYITPVSVLRQELSGFQMDPAGSHECLQAYSAASTSWGEDGSPTIEPPYIRTTHQLVKMLDDHQTAPAADIAKWLFESALGQHPAPLRYPVQFEKSFSAASGYRFIRVVDVKTLSHSRPSDPIPTKECQIADECIRISNDGKSLIVRFKLWSGPTVDQTRGWLEMLIVAEQCRKGGSNTCVGGHAPGMAVRGH